MKINKQDKGWILEELSKKQECLNANEFGGENPEDVEKKREEKEKEINKRFTDTEKNAKKVVGDDHEEKGKPMKEYLENKKDLSTFIKKLQEDNIHYTIKRSDIADYRYLVEYFKDKNISSYRGVKIQFNEGKYIVHFNDGELKEATTRKEAKEFIRTALDEKLVEDDIELLELPEDEPIENKDLPDAIPEEPIIVSTEVSPEVEDNAMYMALSGEVRDTLLDIENLKSLVVTFADNEDEEVINTLNSIIDDRTIHSGLLQGLMDKFNSKVGEESKDVEVTLTDDAVVDDEVKQESLDEDVDSDLDEFHAKFKNSFWNKEENRVECADEKEAEEVAKYFGLDDKHISGNEVDGWRVDFEIEESLNEGHVVNNYKGYDLDWNDDKLDLENGVADITISIMKDGKEVATAKSLKDARKWIDGNGEVEVSKIFLPEMPIRGEEAADELEDMKIMPHGEVTKEQWEDFLSKAKWPYWNEWETIVHELANYHDAEDGYIIECLTKKESLDEKLDLHDAVFNIFDGKMEDKDIDSYVDNIRKTHKFKSDAELLNYIKDNKEEAKGE